MDPSRGGIDTGPYGRAWVEINPEALLNNLDVISRRGGEGMRVVPMVKADAYGLGVEEVVRVLASRDPYGFGVATVEEGLQLRTLGVTRPIMIYSPVPPGQYRAAVKHGLILSLSSLYEMRALEGAVEDASRPCPVQIEVDTGMGRAGFPAGDVDGWWPPVRDSKVLSVAGLWTHLHSADEPDPGASRKQIKAFEALWRRLDGLPGGALIHVANSAGGLRLDCEVANATRPGYFLYGGRVGDDAPDPEPVVDVRARVALVRQVPAGTTLGYGATYRARRTERWATVAIGYGDGLPRALGNRGHALMRGRRVPIIGRISMDATVVDITDVAAVEPGEAVTFIGSDAGAQIALDEVADTVGTIGYEILTGLSPRLPRVWARQP